MPKIDIMGLHPNFHLKSYGTIGLLLVKLGNQGSDYVFLCNLPLNGNPTFLCKNTHI